MGQRAMRARRPLVILLALAAACSRTKSEGQAKAEREAVRTAPLDAPPPFAGAFRPEEAHACRVLDAAIRTIDALPAVDFVLFGGDSIDDAQKNELDWFLRIVGGGAQVACDSGKADDPVAGAGN